MRQFQKELIKSARPETKPEIPKKLSWKAKFFGRQMIDEYLWKYYERESEKRIPFYLPYVYMKDCFDHMRRYAKIPRKQIRMVLIDGNDARIDYFLEAFLGELNDLTIVTDRKAYFENLQERAFEELGLLIDLSYSWEAKNLRGNLVWDFSDRMQCKECYPKGSICFMPHKKEWKLRELQKSCPEITIFSLAGIECLQKELSATMAECLLVPADFPFRKTRCEELKIWCREKQWVQKMRVQNPEKP